MKKTEIQLKLENLWTSMLAVTMTATLLSATLACSKKRDSSYSKVSDAFSFNLPSEIKNLDPLLVRGINQRYLLFNIHRGLYYYGKDNKLKAHGAKTCKSYKNNTLWTCTLKKLNYHNKKPITAKDYINSFELIKETKEESLDTITNITSLSSNSDLSLIFKLKSPSPFFLHQLTSLNLSPREEKRLYPVEDKGLSFSGPYYVESLTSSRVLLKTNKQFDKTKKIEVSVFGVFIDDATTALNLYETGQIDFLRYLETSFYSKYKEKAFLSPHVKMDGIFLNPALSLELRKKLTHSLKYEDLQKIFSSKGRPGCLQLPDSYFSKKTTPLCFEFERQERVKLQPSDKLKISVPSISQKDHVRLAEWLKKEWQTNLGLDTEIEQIETKIFYQKANRSELSIYRRSVPLTELHCDHAKRVLLDLPEFKNLNLNVSDSCSSFFDKALKSYLWIPLGLVHLPHLHASRYQGYYINLLDQFGLEHLEKVTSYE